MQKVTNRLRPAWFGALCMPSLLFCTNHPGHERVCHDLQVPGARSLGERQRPAAAPLQLLDDRVSVEWAARDDGQDKRVEVALQGFSSHTSPLYA